MKKRLNYLHVLLLFIAVPFLAVSCKSDPVPWEPLIAGVYPGNGLPGDVITITGTNFGQHKSKVRVRFNTVDAQTILSVTDTKIEVEVPPGFSDETVAVRTVLFGAASNAADFRYDDWSPPSIATVSTTCFYNSVVIITGENFSTDIANNRVLFGPLEGTVIEATKTQLKVRAPDLGTETSAEITVIKDDIVSNPKSIAVEPDQDKIAKYEWDAQTVRSGIVYKSGEFDVFGDVRKIHILDVTLDAANKLGIAVSPTHKSTVAICNDNNAIVGVNAGYFPLGTSSDKDPYIRINGTTVQAGHGNVSQLFTNSALMIHNNVASVRKFIEGGRYQNELIARIPASEAENIIVCGPMLLTNDVIETLNMSESHNNSLTGRTGIGTTADGKRVFMVVVEYRVGTTAAPRGVTTLQLAKILQALGARNAMNLDGGGSSTMFVKDQGDNGRVSANGNILRSVHSIIYVK